MPNITDKYVLVTGGLGYIGSHVVKKLLESGNKVIAIDLKTSKDYFESVFSKYLLEKQLCIYTFDLCKSGKDLYILLQNHDIWGVVHCAAFKSVPESASNPLMYYQNNLISIMNILEWMKENNIYNFLYSSSACVYGNCNRGSSSLYEDKEDKLSSLTFKENEYWDGGPPNNPYGITKLMGELILQDLAKSDNRWNIITLRYFNPGVSHLNVKQGDSGLFTAINRVLKGEEEYLKIFGNDYNTPDGSCIRDYIHIDDLVCGHICALEKINSRDHEDSNYEVVNLGQGIGHSTLEVAKIIKSIVMKKKQNGSEILFNYKIVDRRKGDDVISVANCEKAKTFLNWKSKKTMKDICDEIVNEF